MSGDSAGILPCARSGAEVYVQVKAVRAVGFDVYEMLYPNEGIRLVLLLIIVIDPRLWALNFPFHNIYTEQRTCPSSHSAPTAVGN